MGIFSKENKKKSKLDDTSLDSELDFDFGDEAEEFKIDSKKRKPIENFTTGFKDSVKRNLADPNNYKKTILRALPHEYEAIDTVLTENYRKLSSSYDKAVSDLRPELTKISNKVNKLLPENQKLLRKLYDKTLGKFKEESSRGPSEEVDPQAEQINKSLNEIFKKQQAVDVARDAKQDARESIRDKLEQNRHASTSELLGSINNNLAILKGYQDDVTQAYQKKSLELQYRSYFVQAETLKTLKEHNEALRAENKSIIYNTSLPDFVKTTKSEEVKKVFASKFGEKIHGAMFNNKYVENLTKSITNKLNETVKSIKTGIAGIEMVSGMVDSPAEMVGGITGDFLADSISQFGSEKLKALIAKNPELAKTVQQKGKKAANILVHNTEAHAVKFANTKLAYNPDDGPIKTFIKSFLADILKGAAEEPSSKLESAKTSDDLYATSLFTNKAHTSITEVIPGYLSRILREVTVLRTGDDSISTQVYDYQTSKFTTGKALVERYKKKLKDEIGDSSASSSIKDLTSEISGKESKKVQAEVSKAIVELTQKRMVYGADAIKDDDTYKNLSPAAQKAMDDYLSNTDDLDVESKFAKIKMQYRDPKGMLEEGMRLGHGDTLEKIGIIKRDEEGLFGLNKNKFKDIIATGKATSDINAKENISGFHPSKALDAIKKTKIYNWLYKKGKGGKSTEDQQEHIGPMAQDVRKNTGKRGSKNGKEIDLISLNGQNMAAIQALDKEINKLKKSKDPGIKGSALVAKTITTSFKALITKMDQLIKVTESKGGFSMPSISMPSLDFSKLDASGKKLLAFLNKYRLDEATKAKYIEALQNGSMKISTIMKEVGRTYKITKGNLDTSSIGAAIGSGTRIVISKGLEYGKAGLDKLAEGYSKVPGILKNTAEWTGDKLGKIGGFISDKAKQYKDPVFDAMTGLFHKLTDFAKSAADMTKDVLFNHLPKGMKSGYDIISNLAKKVNQAYLACDVYVKGETEPRLTARLMRNGFYRLQATGKAIESFKDISGTIVDDSGNVVLSSEDIKKGLVDKDGKPLATPFEKLVTNLGTSLKRGVEAAGNLLSGLAGGLGIGFGNISKPIDKITDILASIHNILVVKFKMKDVPLATGSESKDGKSATNIFTKLKGKIDEAKEGLKDKLSSLFGLDGKQSTISEKLGDLKGKATEHLTNFKDKIKGFFSKPETAPETTTPETTEQPTPEVTPAVTTEASESQAQGAKQGLFSKLKGKVGPTLSNLGAGLKSGFGKLGGKVGGKLGLLTGFFKGKPKEEGTEGEEPVTKISLKDRIRNAAAVAKDKAVKAKDSIKEKAKGAASAVGAKISSMRKNSAEARLAAIDEENKGKHQFQETKVESRYAQTGEGILGMMGKMFDFVKGLFTPGGISDLFGKVLSKIPGVGKFFGGGAKAAGVAGEAAGAASKAGSVLSKVGKIAKIAKGGIIGAAAGMALDAIGAPEWMSTAANTLGMASMAAGLFGTSLTAVAGTVLSGAAAVIGSPVILTGLAIAGTAYLGYKAFKYFTRDSLDDYQKIRYSQYGFNLDNENHTKKIHYIKELEDFILESGISIEGGNVSLNNKIDTKKFFEIVDINPTTNQEDANRFMQWFINRFKPFFLKHCVSLYKASSDYKLGDLKKLSDEAKMIYLTGISTDLDGPYSYNTPPYKDMDPLTNDRENVKIMIEGMISKLKTEKKVAPPPKIAEGLKKEVEAKEARDNKVASDTNLSAGEKAAQEIAKETGQIEKDSKTLAQGELNKGNQIVKAPSPNIGNNLPGPSKQDGGASAPEGDGNSPADILKPNDSNIPISSELRTATGELRDGSKAMQYITVANKSVNIDGIDPAVKRNLFGMIQEYGEMTGKKVIITDGKRSTEQQAALHAKDPKKAAPPGRSLHEFGLAIDMDRVNYNEMDALGLMRKYGFTRPVGGEPWHGEPAGIQANIARAKTDLSFREQAVAASLFKGGGGYGTVSGATKYKRDNKIAMAALLGDGKVVDPNTILAGGKDNKDINDTAALSPGKPPSVPVPSGAASASVSPAIDTNKPSVTNTTMSTNGSTGPDVTPSKPSIVTSTDKAGNTWDRLSTAPGASSGENNGLDMAAPPKSPNSKIDGTVYAAIEKASADSGVDKNKLLTMAAIESDFKPYAKAKTSSAKGLYQFIDSTWQEMAKKAKLGPNANPMDPYSSAMAASVFIKNNESILSKGGIKKPTIFEDYTAHFLGPGGAIQLLKADPSAIAADVMPKAANANKAIFFPKGTPATVDGVKQIISSKIEGKTKAYGIPYKGVDGSSVPPAALASSGGTEEFTPRPSIGFDTSGMGDAGGLTARPSIGFDTSGMGDAGEFIPRPSIPFDTSGMGDAGEFTPRPSIPFDANKTLNTATSGLSRSSIYDKVSSITGSAISGSSTPTVQTSGAQDNYAKLLTDNFTTSNEYLKTMVTQLTSIDSKLGKALEGAIAAMRTSEGTISSAGNSKNFNEKPTPSVEMRRRYAM